ncbi:unnamed protein product [Aphanomyces euteiches]
MGIFPPVLGLRIRAETGLIHKGVRTCLGGGQVADQAGRNQEVQEFNAEIHHVADDVLEALYVDGGPSKASSELRLGGLSRVRCLFKLSLKIADPRGSLLGLPL